MKKRFLGKSGFETSEIGFGCMGLNHHRGPAKDPKEMIKIVHSAINMGITMFDTAEVYGPYTNEELVGNALKGHRDQVQIATKGGFKIEGKNYFPDSTPENLKKAIEGSLKRLGTDYIDLYYIHRIDPNIPIEEVAYTIGKFIEQGKIKYWGLSEASSETIKRAHKTTPLTVVENEYSMWWRESEETIFSTLQELGIGLVAYSPLGRGFLTGSLTGNTNFSENDNRKDLPRFQKEAMEANQVFLDFINELTKEKNATPAQICLAWILSQKPWIVPIPGTTKINRLKENIEAANITFSSQEKAQINDSLLNIKVVGDRYSSSEQQRVGK